jgi:hypothetical protein
MYRNRRRRKLQRRRRAGVVAASIAVLAVAIGLPTLASANGVDNLLNGVGLSGGSGGGGDTSGSDASSPSPQAGVPPNYVPPLVGTGPHGQGTDAVVDLSPSDTNPLPPYPDSGQDVIVGDSEGSQNPDGTYHGRVTAANILGLTLPDLLQIETNPGESKDGALQQLNELLGPNGQLCAGGTGVCLTVLDMHSSTTATGSHNSFSAVDVGVLGQVAATALTSEGDISHDPATGCQTAHGSSQVAGANALGLLGADTLPGESTSTSCPNGSQSVSQSSGVLGLTGLPGSLNVPITSQGCEDGTPNTQPDLLGLAPILAGIGVLSAMCNANDQDSGQTSNPYGVREGLTAFLLPIAGGLIKVTTAGPESHAVAQAAPVTPTTPSTPLAPPAGNQGNKGNKGKNNKGNGGNGGAGGGAGAAAGAAAAGNGQLAFTGADLLVLGLVGGALILGGLALTTTAGRRHRRTI